MECAKCDNIGSRRVLRHLDATVNESDISGILQRVHAGEREAQNELFLHINHELRQIASGLMRRERVDHTLNATALVNEACLRLVQRGGIDSFESRRHLFGAAIRAMRQALVDHARSKQTEKRGGELKRQPLDIALENFETSHQAGYLDLEAALERLNQESPRQREVVELRFFVGLTIDQTAKLLGCSHGTVETDWRTARAKLYMWLNEDR